MVAAIGAHALTAVQARKVPSRPRPCAYVPELAASASGLLRTNGGVAIALEALDTGPSRLQITRTTSWAILCLAESGANDLILWRRPSFAPLREHRRWAKRLAPATQTGSATVKRAQCCTTLGLAEKPGANSPV